MSSLKSQESADHKLQGDEASSGVLTIAADSLPLDPSKPSAVPVTAPSATTNAPAGVVSDEKATEASKAPGGPPGGGPAPMELSKVQFWLVFASMLLSVFLFALDQLILATATPKIVSEFNALSQVAWLSNGFFVTLASFSLAWGQYLTIWSVKYSYLASILIFELGSLVCAVSKNMPVMVFGRALAGVGASGIFQSAFQVIFLITTLQNRPKFIGLIGGVFGIASVVGPLVGGAFTDGPGWRWCFWINLPFGAVAGAMVFAFLKHTPPARRPGQPEDTRPMWKKVAGLDFVGLVLALGASVSLCLAFDLGGTQYSWKNARVIILILLIPGLLSSLTLWSLWLGVDKAMVPIIFFKRRAVTFGSFTGFFGWGTYMIMVVYLSIQFQAVQGVSAIRAGIELLPLILVGTACIIGVGRVVSATGHYKWLIVAGPCFLTLGSGLLYSTGVDTPLSRTMGFEVLIGFGQALFLQNLTVVIQIEFDSEKQYLSKAMGLNQFIAQFGRVVALSVSTTIFSNLLPGKLEKLAPGLSPSVYKILAGATTAIRDTNYVPIELRAGVIEAYMEAIRPLYLYALASALCAILISLPIPDRNLKKQGAPGPGGPPGGKSPVKDVEAQPVKDEEDKEEN